MPLDPLTAAHLAIEDHIDELRGDPGKAGLDGEQGRDGIDGRDGTDGKAGLPGTDGRNGTDGKAGADGEDGEGITWRGPWKSGTRYELQDAVEFEGSSYIATQPTAGKPPGRGWDLMAKRGADGASGRSGYIPRAGGSTGGGSALEVSDEGVSLDTAVTSFDFVGPGVSASVVGHAVTVTMPGAVSDPDSVRDAGRWEVAVFGSPPEPVTNPADDDWVYGWVAG